jgi:Sigma-70 region 2
MNRDRSTTPPGGEPCPPEAPPALLDPATIEAQRPYIVRWLVWAAVPKEDVADLTQDIVFALWRTRARYAPRGPTPAAWVRAFTKNIARSYMQSARVRREVPIDPATGPWADQAPEESCLDQAKMAEQLHRACSEVIERTRRTKSRSPSGSAARATCSRACHPNAPRSWCGTTAGARR